MSELKACPYCGSDAHISSDGEDGRYGFYAACDVCYCAVGEAYDKDAMPDHCFATEQEAIAAWNQRHLENKLRELVDSWKNNARQKYESVSGHEEKVGGLVTIADANRIDSCADELESLLEKLI